MFDNKPCHRHPHGPIEPPHYPFDRPARDSYEMGCHHPHPVPPPPPFRYPTSGPFVGTEFALIDTMPYIVDSSCTEYGQVLNIAESVHTKVTPRKDPSCIDLAATFDLMSNNLTNGAKLGMFNNCTAKKYGVLNGVLPIIKSGLKFKIYYTVTDVDLGIVHQDVLTTEIPGTRFHMTSIQDLFIQSAKGFVIGNIPTSGYGEIYNFTIDRVEVYVNTIDTRQHIEEGVNPYYNFADNNMKILLNKDAIMMQIPDDEIMLTACDIGATVPFRGNLTNRVKINFVAFMSSFIACGDTYKTWEALYSPTEETVAQMQEDIANLMHDVEGLIHINKRQDDAMKVMAKHIDDNHKTITELYEALKNQKAEIVTLNGEIKALTERVDKLESIPLALVAYHGAMELKRGQLTWTTDGELYQVTVDYRASGSIENDAMTGYLVPLKDKRINIIN